jgi:hypothetical protein
VIRYVGDESKITEWSVNSPRLTSRIASNLSFDFKFKEKGAELKTNVGPAISIPPGYVISSLLHKVTHRVSDLFLGTPAVLKKTYLLKNITPIQSQSVQCSVKTPWVDAFRQVSNQKKGILVTDSIIMKKAWIQNSEMQTPIYQEMQTKLDDCFNGFAIVFNREKVTQKIR